MAGFAEYAQCDGLALAEHIAKGDVSAAEVLEEAINRTEAVNGEVNAVVLKHYDEARKTAKSDIPQGAFAGVPYLLKDLHVALAGTETSFGSRAWKGWTAKKDNFYTRKCKQAGLVIFGKTNSPELGLTGTTEPVLYGPTRNPWNVGHSAGGSSGGAAAAVAAGIIPIAHASDGGGSIRMPAANCGLFGMKPTRGRVSFGPARGEGWAGMSINHAVSRSVRDSAALLDALEGWMEGDPYDAPAPPRPYLEEVGRPAGRLKIAFSGKRFDGGAIDPEVSAAVEDVAKLCAGLGHEVEEASPDLPPPAEIGGHQMKIIGSSVALALRERGEERGKPIAEDEVERATWEMAQRGGEVSAADYIAGINFIHALGRRMARFHTGYDVFLTPTYAVPPVELGVIDMNTDDLAAYGQLIGQLMPFTGLANMTGQPSMSVPLAWSESGLPMGMMFTGRFGDESTLYRLAAQLEEARPWRDKRPPVFAA